MSLAARLAPHYSRFRVSERLLLTGHSHQAWPDVALLGLEEAYADAAELVDEKWSRAFARAEDVREGFRRLLDDPDAEIALGSSTHELLVRFLSALDLRARPRIVTTDGEFHSARRQLARLGEAGVELVVVSASPADTLAERLAAEVDERTAAVLTSSVLFATSRVVAGLDEVAAACERVGAELLVDAYHQLGVVPLSLDAAGLTNAWVVGGGYKYLQLGEGNCFLRLPPHASSMRPVVTGWYAEFGALAGAGGAGEVVYGPGATRFAGSTYDPTSHYRAARVLRFFADQGLTADVLAASYRRQREVLASAFDALGASDEVITRDRTTPSDGFGGFLSLETPHAGRLQELLAGRGVLTDSRGSHLRLGPAPYLSDAQLTEAVAHLGEAIRELDATPRRTGSV
ncbi:kynureninase [Nocardioides phosphati]|uniref:Kynureninase n=1 Tax=Nocardioides phosphati TaxID=1867775 RepID=A0ABQ2N7Z4_9ACTN|nr:aminotransferase class V-fold PLP-dependent enzyme [Nocardioides phosphati]GGO86784.1 kynureninase [Nocardioides phosphati]